MGIGHFSFKALLIFTTMVPAHLAASEQESVPSSEPGFDWDLLAIGDGVLSRGGLNAGGELLGYLSIGFAMDLDVLLGWPGATAYVRGLAVGGGEPSVERIGDAQTASNIEAPDSVRLIEAWLRQELGPFSLRAGILALDASFTVIPQAALFIHSSPGVVAAFGASGTNGPSIFPVTSLGVQAVLRLEPVVIRAALVEDDPGDPRVFKPRFAPDEGLLGIVEAAWTRPRAETCLQRQKIAAGTYGYTTQRFDPTEERERRGPVGAFLVGQQAIWCEEDPKQGLVAYLQFDVADTGLNLFDRYLGSGLEWTGALEGRDDDSFGVMFAAARFGEGFRETRLQAGQQTDPWEVAFELVYTIAVTPWLSVTPDVQYIVNPGGAPDRSNAVVGLLRVAVEW